MWFLILFPIAWLVSEFGKMGRPTRVTLGVLAIAATAWLTYDVCRLEFEMRERVLQRQTPSGRRTGQHPDDRRPAASHRQWRDVSHLPFPRLGACCHMRGCSQQSKS